MKGREQSDSSRKKGSQPHLDAPLYGNRSAISTYDTSIDCALPSEFQGVDGEFQLSGGVATVAVGEWDGWVAGEADAS